MTSKYTVEYTALSEDENGYIEAINYESFGMAENGEANVFDNKEDAIYYFKDYIQDQMRDDRDMAGNHRYLESVEENDAYLGWGTVVTATYDDGYVVNWSLRIEETEEVTA